MRRPIRRSRLRFYRRSSVPRRLFCRVAFAPSLSRRRRRLHRRQSRPHHRVTIRDNVVILFRVVMKAMMMMRRFRAMEKRPPLPDDNKDFFFTPREGGKKKRRRRGRRQSAAHFVLLLFSLCAMIGTRTIPTRHTLLLHLPIPLFFVRSPYVYAIHKDIIQKTLYTNKTLKKREKKKNAPDTYLFFALRDIFFGLTKGKKNIYQRFSDS